MRNANRGARANKKKWLLQYQELKLEVEREAEDAGYWQDKAKSLSSPQLDNYGIRSANPMSSADYIVKFLDIARDCAELGKQAQERKNEIVAAIDKIENQEHRIILKMIYIDDLNMVQICQRLHYGMRWVKQLHADALDALIIPDR